MVRRILKWTGGALLLYAAYFVYSMATGEARMTAVCRQITPGMSIRQLAALAEEHGLALRQLNADTRIAYLGEKRTMGRHACRVELKDGAVTGASFNFAD